jgi:hypothetical protein
LRKCNDRENSQNCSERNKKAFDACDDERERVTFAPEKASAGNQNADCGGDAREEENSADCNKEPAKKRRRRLLITRPRMLSSVKQEPADYAIEQREKRQQRREPGDHVMKNRQQVQMLAVLAHDVM